jgi:hypothetical protein
MISTIDIAWAAGFMEGEACFSYQSGNSISVVVAQVNREPLEKLASLFEGTISFQERRNPRHNNIYIWCVAGIRAAQVCMTVYSFMSEVRKEKIRSMIDKWRVLRSVRSRNAARCRFGHPLSGENLMSKGRCKVCHNRDCARRERGYRAKRKVTNVT